MQRPILQKPSKKKGAVKGKGFLHEVKKNRTLLLMLAPAFILTFIFAYVPMGGLVLAFKQFNYNDGIFGSPWVALDNFKFFFQSGQVFNVTRNTALYNLAFIFFNTGLEVLFAIILSEMTRKRPKKIIQSMYFLPYFISWVIVGSIAYSLFNYENGTLNSLLTFLGMEPVNVYGSPESWPLIIIGFSAWKNIGYGMVVYMAAIVGVDASLYEAAKIDGAGLFHRVRHITLPAITPTIITLVLLAVGRIFRGSFDLFYQLVGNNGALFDATDVIDTFVFRSLMQSSELGMTAAVGFYQSVLCFITIIIVNHVVKKIESDYALF